MNFIRIYIPALLIITLTACNSRREELSRSTPETIAADSIIKLNRELLSRESQEIDDYCNRYHLEMNKSSTGLRFMILGPASGTTVQEKSTVEIRYEVRLLTGDLIYQTPKGSSVLVNLGRREIPRGFEEGILLMKKGQRSKLIVPSHLALGLLGDMKEVPVHATLVYDIQLLNIREPQK